MTYIDGFILPLPKKNKAAYQKMATEAGKTWIKHGALRYVECIGDDLNLPWSTLKFMKMAKAKKGETVLFSFIIYNNRKHRDSVNKKVMKELQEKYDENMSVPFDMKRIGTAGFEVLVDFTRKR